MERSRVAIIVPALNEAATIGHVLSRIAGHGRPIVVDDGSTDDTGRLARAAGAEVVTHAVNQGYDGALNSGFARAAQLGCDYLITLDADGQHDPRNLPAMIGHLHNGYELVLGVRDHYQRLGERVFAGFARRRWYLSDPLCGLKGYHVDLYRRAGRFDGLKSIGTELAVRSKCGGARTIEIPIVTGQRADSPRFGGGVGANLKILGALVRVSAVYGAAPRSR